MTTDDDPPPGVRRLLDALPAPPVRPVDLPAVYAAAARHEARAARRWRRAAGAAAALAAGVLAFAALPALEVRAGGGGITIRWDAGPPAGDPPPAPGADRVARLEDRLREAEARLGRLDEQARRVEDLAAAQAELKDLLLAVSSDLNRLEAAQAGSAEQQQKLAAWLSARLRDVDGRLAEVRKDSTAIYTLVTDARKRFPQE